MLASAALVLIARHLQNEFAPDPKHPWVVKGLGLTYRERDIMSYPSDCWGLAAQRRPASRWEYAIAVHAAETNRLQRLKAFLKTPGDDIERASLIRSLALPPFYRRADKEFLPELTQLGVRSDDRLVQIEPLTRQIMASGSKRHLPFRDVPFDHWAAKAVGDLRALGLLNGYPDERFRGWK